MSFKVVNTLQNNLTNKLNYLTRIPLLKRYSTLQIGDYKLSAGELDINGWIVCDGRSLLISEYQTLYNLIGSDFGSEDELHFNIPDYTSKVIGIFGVPSNKKLTKRQRGENVGHETINLSVEQLPEHYHSGTTDTAGSHSHYVDRIPYGVQNLSESSEGEGITVCNDTTRTIPTNASGTHTHTFVTEEIGNNDDINIMQPTLFGATVMIYSKFLDRFESIDSPW